jgi:hypothetical protein
MPNSANLGFRVVSFRYSAAIAHTGFGSLDVIEGVHQLLEQLNRVEVDGRYRALLRLPARHFQIFFHSLVIGDRLLGAPNELQVRLIVELVGLKEYPSLHAVPADARRLLVQVRLGTRTPLLR